MPYDPSKDRTQMKATTPFQARRAYSIVASDTQDLSPYAKAIYVGVAGDVAYIPTRNTDQEALVVLKNAAVGYHPIQARRIMATGTTATNMVAFYDDEG